MRLLFPPTVKIAKVLVRDTSPLQAVVGDTYRPQKEFETAPLRAFARFWSTIWPWYGFRDWNSARIRLIYLIKGVRLVILVINRVKDESRWDLDGEDGLDRSAIGLSSRFSLSSIGI